MRNKHLTIFMCPCMHACRMDLITVCPRTSTRYDLQNPTRMWGYSGCLVCFLQSPRMAQSSPSLIIVSKPSGLLTVQTCTKSTRYGIKQLERPNQNKVVINLDYSKIIFPVTTILCFLSLLIVTRTILLVCRREVKTISFR